MIFCLFCRFPFWFLKSSLFCISPRSFSKTMNYCAWFWKMPFSCFGFGKLPIIAPRSSGRFSFGKSRIIARTGKHSFSELEISASLAAGKTDFCIFGKLKRITRRASAKKSRYWKIILLVCQSGRFASAEQNKHTILVCLYWKISNKMMFLLYIGKFHSNHDYMENFIRKI